MYVCSEGKSLSHNDAQTYWGEISHTHEDNVDVKESNVTVAQDTDPSDGDKGPKRLQVIGSVFSGWGLEPVAVARFLMKESSSHELQEEDNEDEEDTTEEVLERTFEKKGDEDDLDWSTAFQ